MMKRIAMIGGLAAAIATSAFAAETSSTTKPRLLDSVALKYWGQYSGPAAGGAAWETADGSAGAGYKGQNLDGYFTVGYRPDKDTILGAGLPFKFGLVTEKATGIYQGMALTLKDPYLQAQRSNFVNRGALKMWADLRLYSPLATYSTNNTIGGIRSTQLTTYDIPNSRFQLGTYTWVRHQFYAAGKFSGDAAYDWAVNVSPFVNYQITSKLGATVWTDIVQTHNVQGQGYVASITNDMMDVQPGLSWDVLPNLNLNPYINIYPQNPMISNTTLNLNISATFL